MFSRGSQFFKSLPCLSRTMKGLRKYVNSRFPFRARQVIYYARFFSA